VVEEIRSCSFTHSHVDRSDDRGFASDVAAWHASVWLSCIDFKFIPEISGGSVMNKGYGLAVLSGAVVLAVNSTASAGTVIYDNFSSGYTTDGISSQFDTAYPFESQAADDFVLGTAASITGVNFVGSYFNPGPPGSITAFNIEFYADSGTGTSPTGGPGDPTGTALAAYTVAGDGGEVDNFDGTFSYSVALPSGFSASAGVKYWVSIQAAQDFPPQWAWQASADNTGAGSVFGFPLLGTDYWTDVGSVFGLPTADLAFQLTPAPGALALFGLAGMGLRRRRR
jgi:hypothetical protein